MISISAFDWVIIAVYMSVMIGIGFHFTRKVKNTTDYFLAGRSLGAFPIACSIAATVIGGAAMFGRTGIIYSKGLAGVSVALPYLLGMVVMGFVFPIISKIGIINKIETLPALFGFRYGKGTQFIIGLFCALGMGTSVATQIAGCASVFSLMGGGALTL